MLYGLFSFVNPSDTYVELLSLNYVNIAKKQHFSCDKFETTRKFYKIFSYQIYQILF
jgi:hypothetical protein